MNRHNDTETLTLLREIRDLVQILVLREIPLPTPCPSEEDRPARKLFTWASLHGNSTKHPR
ncbi:MAG TPA: hypothetical protein VJ692_05825 [Nitrospiraceae bacterium]|nr:hypothetical protein [Nitrospiraceae bacterium]